MHIYRIGGGVYGEEDSYGCDYGGDSCGVGGVFKD